ncbi:MAG: excisionase family DNA-binding protein [Anaerolineae bacterium]|nr:excisionase family DNA-binding protein [Anaerolineae bacterium]
MVSLPTDLGDTLTVQEAADALGGTYESVWSLVQDGRLPGYRLGGTWCIPRAEFERRALTLSRFVTPRPGTPLRR